MIIMTIMTTDCAVNQLFSTYSTRHSPTHTPHSMPLPLPLLIIQLSITTFIYSLVYRYHTFPFTTGF